MPQEGITLEFLHCLCASVHRHLCWAHNLPAGRAGEEPLAKPPPKYQWFICTAAVHLHKEASRPCLCAIAACSAVCTNSPSSACCSLHFALSFPLSTSAIFPYQWVLFWSVYFFGNRRAPLKQRIIICPHEFSPAWLNLSSTGERL